MSLTGRQKRHLRALGHHLNPVVQIGKGGQTEGVSQAADEALTKHELIKIKLLTECPGDRDEIAAALSAELRSEVAQAMGRTILLYRRHPQKPVIVLPAAESTAKRSKKTPAAP